MKSFEYGSKKFLNQIHNNCYLAWRAFVNEAHSLEKGSKKGESLDIVKAAVALAGRNHETEASAAFVLLRDIEADYKEILEGSDKFESTKKNLLGKLSKLTAALELLGKAIAEKQEQKAA